jgi:hypothetical protein
VPHGLLTDELGLDGEKWLQVDELLGRRWERTGQWHPL